MTSGDPNIADPRLAEASARFGELQTRIVAAMEKLEVEFAGSDSARQPGRFVHLDRYRRRRFCMGTLGPRTRR
jgi:hypothetical protein